MNPKTILITGAGSGIGRDAAFALAARGHRVIATTYSEAQADALRETCRSRAPGIEVLKLDITSASDRAQILEQPLDVLLNNAGVGESGSLAEVDVDRIRQAFEVNVFATLELTQLALRGMIARRQGTVLFVSSIAGRVPMPSTTQASRRRSPSKTAHLTEDEPALMTAISGAVSMAAG